MTQFWHDLVISLLAIACYNLFMWLTAPHHATPQVPCRCGAAPVTSVVVLPDMVVRS